MKVSLWAEIRRLHEVEHLSDRAIARRLRCCTKTVAKALAMTQPPTEHPKPRESILDPFCAKIDALIARCPELTAPRVLEEISKGPEGYQGIAQAGDDGVHGRTSGVRNQASGNRGQIAG